MFLLLSFNSYKNIGEGWCEKKVKKCLKCGHKLPKFEFYEDASNEDGLSVNCKKCIDKYYKQYEE